MDGEEGFGWDTGAATGIEKSPALAIPLAFIFATQLLIVERTAAMEGSLN